MPGKDANPVRAKNVTAPIRGPATSPILQELPRESAKALVRAGLERFVW